MSDGEPGSSRRSVSVAVPFRRRPMSFHAFRVGVAGALAVLTAVLFPTSPAVDLPVYEVGSIAADNVIAPFAFRVLKTPAELKSEQNALATSVEPVFTFVPAALDSARQSLNAFAAALGQAAAATPQTSLASIQRVAQTWGVQLSVPQATYLTNPARRQNVMQAINRVFDRWLSVGVASAGSLDSVRGMVMVRVGGEERRMTSDSIATFNMLMSRARLIHPDPGSTVGDAVYMRLLASFFHPTIVADRATTELRREEVRRSVATAKYDVQAGEKIIGANEVVGRGRTRSCARCAKPRTSIAANSGACGASSVPCCSTS